jgi:hypothetical protein
MNLQNSWATKYMNMDIYMFFWILVLLFLFLSADCIILLTWFFHIADQRPTSVQDLDIFASLESASTNEFYLSLFHSLVLADSLRDYLAICIDSPCYRRHNNNNLECFASSMLHRLSRALILNFERTINFRLFETRNVDLDLSLGAYIVLVTHFVSWSRQMQVDCFGLDFQQTRQKIGHIRTLALSNK